MPKQKPTEGASDERVHLLFDFMLFIDTSGKRLDLCDNSVRVELITEFLTALDNLKE